MQSNHLKTGKFKNFIYHARNHRIPIHTETRKIGITYTLIGWLFIAFIMTHIPTSVEVGSNFTLLFRFLLAFFAGTFWLSIASLCEGKKFLKIESLTENKSDDQTHHIAHLSVPERKALLFWRSLIAIVGFMLYSWAKSNTQIIDNSVVFSSDAIIYALIMVFILKMKLNLGQITSIAVVFLGICYIASYDIFNLQDYMGRNLISLSIAFISAACLAIIILLNSVIIQHEPPLRVAFFQCLLGLIFTIIIIGAWIALDPTVIRQINTELIIPSFVSGTIYALALLFFFTAFLYVEPFLIVMLGYSVIPFTLFFFWIAGNTIRNEDLIGAVFIIIGGLFSVYLQYRQDKKNTHASIAGYPIYLSTLKDKFRALKQDFLKHRLGIFEYMAQRHEFNKLLFEYANEIPHTDIEKIEMFDGEVVFILKQFNIKMISDKGCRSVPLEILNFGTYEKDESWFIFQLLQDGDLILDIGAHIGWYSIQFAKRYNNSIIHAFEPLPQTCSVLKKNLKLNNISNVEVHNFALGNVDKTEDFFYFTSGSAIASRRNLLEHSKVSKIKCKVTTLDSIAKHLNLKKINFLKCDVEGSELDVINGGLQSISKFLPVIYIELFHGWCEKFGYVPNDVLALLNSMDYKCFKIHNKSFIQVEEINDTNTDFNFFFISHLNNLELINKLTTMRSG